MNETYLKILNELRQSGLEGFAFRQLCMEALDRLDGYDWSGIYRMDGPDFLELDAFVGAPTDHTRIPVGRGVCGSAVAEKENQVVADVAQLDNYLSCSLETRAEIVVLIWSASNPGEIIAQIDIDSHQIDRFGSEDEELLNQMAALIAEKW